MKKYIFGNWKMYLDHNESVALANTLADKIQKSNDYEVAVFPSLLSLLEVKNILGDKGNIGAQNCTWVSKGAYTGEVSAYILASVGCEYVLVGHSERRHVFGESNDDVRKKLEAVLDAGLTPVLCIGETEEDRTADKAQYRLKRQLNKALDGLTVSADKIIFAYEPVWAIGTGNPCSPADAEDVHGFIKAEVKNYIKGEAKVIYGGSVSPDNVSSFLELDMVDGVLVGGASVKSDEFLKMLKITEKNN